MEGWACPWQHHNMGSWLVNFLRYRFSEKWCNFSRPLGQIFCTVRGSDNDVSMPLENGRASQGRSDRGGGGGGVYTPPTFLGQSVIFYFTR